MPDSTKLKPINIFSVLSKLLEKGLIIQLSKYLINENRVPESLQGGLRGRNSTLMVLSQYEYLFSIVKFKSIAALVTSDKRAAYDMINHSSLSYTKSYIT